MRLIDADKLVEDLTNVAELAENVYADSENVVAVFTAFIGFINSIPTAQKAIPAKPLPLYDYETPSNFEGRCPICDNTVNRLDDYCFKCGQRLLWDLKKINNSSKADK